MALRQYQPELYDDSPKEHQATYQAYTPTKTVRQDVKDILFFTNIALFSILTVLSTTIYLSLDIPAVFSLLLGMATGFGSLALMRWGCKRLFFSRK